MDLTVTELPARLQRGERLLGLDPGSKTIGVAVSDSALKVASPLVTLKRGKFGEDAAQLAALCRDYRIGGLVIGLPRNMDGSEGPRRSEEHTSELQSLMRISYAVFCLKKKSRKTEKV